MNGSWKQVLMLGVCAVLITACSGSESTDAQPADDDPTSGQSSNEVSGSSNEDELQINGIWLISSASMIDVDPGQSINLDVLVVEDGGQILSIDMVDGPDWASISSSNRLVISPPETVLGGSLESVSLIAVISDEEGRTKSLATTAEIVISKEIVLLEGVLDATGGELASEWRDVIISSAGGLQHSYSIAFSLMDDGFGRSSLKVFLEPEIDDLDKTKIEIDHAPHDELYMNYARNSEFTATTRVKAQARNTSDSELVDPDSFYTVPEACSRLPYRELNGDNHRMEHVWWGVAGQFVINGNLEGVTSLGGNPRVLPSKEDALKNKYFDSLTLRKECAVNLQSSINSNHIGALLGKEPVLFIHGFDRTGVKAGRDDYFGNFPGMVEGFEAEESRQFFPLIFRWTSNVRMEVVAHELHVALEKINERTGRKVHIVAHSYGGSLLRTLLQGIVMESENEAQSNEWLESIIASVTTVGTPHSGVFEGPQIVQIGSDSWTFQDGFANNLFGDLAYLCRAVTCHQMGNNYPLNYDVDGIYDGFAEYQSIDDDDIETFESAIGMSDLLLGDLALKQAAGYPAEYPNIPSQALIGAQVKRVPKIGGSDEFEVQESDLLISSYGQLWKSETYRDELLEEIEGKPVTEHYLGNEYVLSGDFEAGMFDDDFSHDQPLIDIVPGYTGGYVHMTASAEEYDDSYINYSEVGLEACDKNFIDNCRHATWHYFVNMVESTAVDTAESVDDATSNIVTVFGQVASQGVPLADVDVQVEYSDGAWGLSTNTDANGSFSVEMPFYPNREVKVLLDPTQLVFADQQSLRLETRKFETFEDIAQSVGDIGVVELQPTTLESGTIVLSLSDSSSGIELNDFDYLITSQSGVVVASGSSDEQYSLDLDLPLGLYVVSLSKADYVPTDSYQCEHNIVQTFCSPTIEPEGFVASGGMSIVLTWGQQPDDLDSHLLKYSSTGVEQYHISYRDKEDSGDTLDVDDTTGFGPETVRIQQIDPDEHYVYAVHHYAGSSSITSASNVQVRISIDNSGERIFTPPSNAQSDYKDYWRVFDIRGGVVYPCTSDCIVSSSSSLRSKLDSGLNQLEYGSQAWLGSNLSSENENVKH